MKMPMSPFPCVVLATPSSLLLTWLPLERIKFFEVQAQHAFIRDELSKGRWDAALTRGLFGVMLEVFERTVARDLGPKEGVAGEIEHVC